MSINIIYKYVMDYALIAYSALEKQHPDQNFQGGPNFSKKHPDQNFHGGPNFSKISVRADQNFQRKIWSRTKFFRTKIPVTGPEGHLVGHLMLILTDPLDATKFGAVNSTKSPMEETQGSGWHTGGGQLPETLSSKDCR